MTTTKLLIAMIPLALLIGLLWIVVQVLGRRSTKPSQGAPEVLPYKRKDYLLTAAERSFLGALELALPSAGLGDVRVMCKVRLADLLELPRGLSQSERTTYMNKIDRKHTDFVIVSHNELRPLLVIELDDASHKSDAAKGRDTLKDGALAAAGLPLLRVTAQHGYAVKDLSSCLRRTANPTHDLPANPASTTSPQRELSE